MDPRFASHNKHREDIDVFRKHDPHLERLRNQPLVYRFPLLDRLPDEPGIYSITGGRQIGKSTLLKARMAERIASGAAADNVAYFAGELIDDHHALVRHLSEFLNENKGADRLYIMLDEVTYCREWDRGVKYLADAGMLNRTALILTGSDSVIIRDARVRLPGRRGRQAQVDFHLFPLSFHDFVTLKNPSIRGQSGPFACERETEGFTELLFEAFSSYLVHGGYLTAINDMERDHEIRASTLATYGDWIRGDVLKRGKQEHYLHEVFEAVVKRYGTQLTWNGLAKDLSIDHPATVADYLRLLERMDAVFIQSALREDKLAAAPKKARKVLLADPFIFHAVCAWLRPSEDPFVDAVQPLLNDAEWVGKIVEACATAHFSRFYPTFYIKGEGEVDIAYVKDGKFWPVEIKWTGQIRPKDLKQISKYNNGLICTRYQGAERIGNVATAPLPLTLFRLGSSPTSLQY